MKNIFRITVLVGFVIISGSQFIAAADRLHLELSTDQIHYSSGSSTLSASASIVNPGPPVTVDVHVGIIPPKGLPVYEYPDWNTTLTPTIAKFKVPTGTIPTAKFLSIPVQGTLPPFPERGIYIFFIAFTHPGTFDLVGNIATTFFSVSSSEADRTTEIFNVKSAQSLNNIFSGVEMPRNPGMAENDRSGGHQDSYSSDSVGLSGPTGATLKLIKQFNPYGFMPIMAINKNDQLVGTSFSNVDGKYRLVVFDKDLHILSATPTADFVPNSFGGGYFFMDKDDHAIVVSNNHLKAFPTVEVEKKDEIYELSPLWTSKDIVELATKEEGPNTLYACLPVWDEEKPNQYWCLIAGSYDTDSRILYTSAHIALVEITPDSSHPQGATTRLVDSKKLPRQWNNNTFSVDKEGAYFVTNALDEHGNCNKGFLHKVYFSGWSEKIEFRWSYSYKNCGLLKTGLKNIGSGTTPTIIENEAGRKAVVIVDNDYPKINVVVVDHKYGTLISETPVFSDMRGAAEASVIGVGNYVVVENNFGHTADPGRSQLVPNEPGLAMINVDFFQQNKTPDNIVWENNETSFFAMSMLARESGIIFAHTGDWSDPVSSTEGGMYYISAIDAWDGRTIWRIPLGRGRNYCHEYGGMYFNKEGSLYVGTNSYLFSIQECPECN